MTLRATDVVVIGGGVIGAASAYYLSRAGKRVTLVERRGLGAEASGANVGLVTMLSAYSLEEREPGVLFHLTRGSVEAFATLSDELGVDVEYRREGGVIVAETPEALDALRQVGVAYARAGVPSEMLGPTDVLKCEPAFYSAKILGGIFCPLNGMVNPMVLTQAFAQAAGRLGARLLVGVEARVMTVRGGRVAGVVTSAGEIPCEQVVNAAGAWAADIGRTGGLEIPVTPARGQVMVTERVPIFLRKVVSGMEPMARQTVRGNVVIGSTLEWVGYDKEVTVKTVGAFAREILPHFPALRNLHVIRVWAGLRPMTPDSAPIIELLPSPEGLCLAVGHSRRGICYGPGTGRLVAEVLTGKPPFMDITPLRLSRFASASL